MARRRRWPRYVPVAERRAKAQKKVRQLRRKGVDIRPVQIEGRVIARSFWGQGWCTHLESFSDFSNRLPRGRTYVRNGSVCHLEIEPGHAAAMVSGSRIYDVRIGIQELSSAVWEDVKHKCSGSIGSLLELLQGRLSEEVMHVVTDARQGLFPRPEEISLYCSCPDWATMCKHVAAVLYGIGHRLDEEPELLFTLRGVDPRELIAPDFTAADEMADTGEDCISLDQVGDIFGIDMDEDAQKQGGDSASHASPSEIGEQVDPRCPNPGSRDTDHEQSFAQESSKSAGSKAVTSQQAGSARHTPVQATARATSGREPLDPPTGEKITRLREQCGQSGPEFAKSLGVSVASVYRWENTPGTLTLHRRTLTALRRLYLDLNGRTQ
ncbi:SWIM zinc finger family protein [Desulfovermiculus halophilus]|uniref:SWIM zinc finger family protein n=1 Tax=Desulfovermiculus halophilus TaxID=339722 RepID=UPI0004847E3E|nr:SWIM zinc finger family protein [Desulfovermiculus halophilus]